MTSSATAGRFNALFVAGDLAGHEAPSMIRHNSGHRRGSATPPWAVARSLPWPVCARRRAGSCGNGYSIATFTKIALVLVVIDDQIHHVEQGLR
jgi:hypothetical protein